MTETAFETPGLPAYEPPAQQNYWGFYATERFVFPDGVTFIEFKIMNEGDKVKFQKNTSRDLVLNRAGDARMKMDNSTERWELIKACATDWNLIKSKDEPLPFSPRVLEQWLQVADPKLVADIEAAIRKANPWLVGELKVEDIDKEIENLQELRKEALEREQGEGSSSNR